MMSMCALALLMTTTITSSGSEVTRRADFTISWDISGGGSVNIIIGGKITFSRLKGSGSATLDFDPGGYAIRLEAEPGYIIESKNVFQEGNTLLISATVVIPTEEQGI